MPSGTEPALPRKADGFELIRELGRGGMGVVYEALDLATERRVALKILSAPEDVSEDARRRFEREAKLAASISDPRCVFVFGAHEVEGSPAISMETTSLAREWSGADRPPHPRPIAIRSPNNADST